MDLDRGLRLAAALVLAAITSTAPADAGAQRLDDAEVLTLIDQTSWVGADQRFDVRVHIESKRRARDLELAVTVFGRVPFRSQFLQTVEGRLLGSVLAHQTVRVADAAPAADGTVVATVAPPLRRAGVYPVRIELRDVDDEDPLARLTTHLIHLPDEEHGAPLQVAWIAPIDASPTTRPDGETSLSRATTSRLAALGQALQTHPRIAASLLPAADTLEALAGAPTGSAERTALSSLAAAAASRNLLASTYVPVGIDALLDSGLEREAEAQLSRGVDAIEHHLGRPPAPDTWVADGAIDAATVEWLQARGFRRFVVRDDALEPVRLSTTLTAPFVLAVPDGDRPLAASIDNGLTAHFDTEDQPVIAAHRLLADLAVIYFDHPGREGRGVVVAPPRGWEPDGAFLAAFLNGLAGSPVLTTTTVDGMLEEVAPARAQGDVLERRFAAEDSAPGLPAAAIDGARHRLESFGTLLEEDNHRYGDFEKLLLSSQTFAMGRAQRSAYLRGFHEAVDAELALVEIPDRQSVRLTAREGAIPISILSRTGYPVRVLVRVEGDAIDFPAGGERLVSLTHETTTERVPVHTRSSGAFPLRVTVLSPDGGLAVGASRFTVTSTAASWVGLLLSAGAALFLIAWWGRHIHGRRSGKLIPT